MLKTLVVCLHNWKEEAGNGRKAILLTLKVFWMSKMRAKPCKEGFQEFLCTEAPDWKKEVLYLVCA